MIKIHCNLCKGEIEQEKGFLFEATIVETGIVITGQNLDTTKVPQKKVIHICNKCYNKHIKELLYGGKTK